VLAVLAPGQGSQRPGLLATWLTQPGVQERVDHWSELVDVDLTWAGTTATADEVRATEITQPLLAATALLTATSLPAAPDVLVGHSIGGWTAACLAGVLTEDDALRLVGVRGRAVAACCDGTTGMAAVLGGDADEVLAALAHHDLVAANVNAAGQVVAAGSLDALQALVDAPPAKARVRLLPVAGAFHAPAMAPAVDALAAAAAGVDTKDPVTPLVADTDGSLVTDGAAHLRTLVAATALPVRFDRVWQRLTDLGVDAVTELEPAGVLTGLAKRAMPGVTIRTVDLVTA
jgi:[acyl-carrier-protein] S-malonyltransferase